MNTEFWWENTWKHRRADRRIILKRSLVRQILSLEEGEQQARVMSSG
jgi:hypothetical protein